MTINRATLIGRLGQNPELKHTATGTTVCNFTIATSEKWKDNSGNNQEKTEWHKIVVWSKLAENCAKYLVKGGQVYIEGKIQTRSYDDKTGQKRYITEINASKIDFLSIKNNTNEDKAADEKAGEEQESFTDKEYDVGTDANFSSDSIPF